MSEQPISRINIRPFVSDALDHIQNVVAEAEGIEQLFEELVTQLPFRDELSIVYQGYGSSQARVIASCNQPLSKVEGREHLLASHAWVKTAIQAVGLGQGVQHPDTEQIAGDDYFKRYQNVAIVPMRLSTKKNIGCFVLHSNSKIDEEDIASLDKLADRMAFFVQNNLRRRRNKTFSRFTNDALTKQYSSETEILADVVRYLQEWFREDKVYLLIRDPLHVSRYFLANSSEKITDSYRKKQVDDARLTQIAFSSTMLGEHLRSSNGIQLQRVSDNKFSGQYVPRGDTENGKTPLSIESADLDPYCNSWLGATMHLNYNRSLGHIILHNSAVHAYQVEDDEFLDSMADFSALLLGKFREQEKNRMINILNDFRYGETAGHKSNDLYSLTFSQLKNLYGIERLQISVFDRKKMQLEPVFQSGEFPEISEDKKAEHTKFVLEKGASSRNAIGEHINQELIVKLDDGNNYLVAPMRISRQSITPDSVNQISEKITHSAIGCFMLPAGSIGDYTAATIDDLSDVLAEKINSNKKNQRQVEIINQNHQIANLNINNLAQEDIFKLAHQFVSRSIFAENFYFALHDKAKNSISFPLIFKNNEPWEVKERLININALGKTEAIIHTQRPILHFSRAESEAWYNQPNHEEHGGDPLASWIGVPVFLDSEVIGVMASYHPCLDWVYTKQDLYYLESVAAQISGLFRAFRLSESNVARIALEEANQKLENAQNMIVEREEQMIQYSLIQDIQHRLNNSLGSVSANIDEAIFDISTYANLVKTDELDFSQKILLRSRSTVYMLIEEAQSRKKPETESINLLLIIEDIIETLSSDKGIAKEAFEIEIAEEASHIESIRTSV